MIFELNHILNYLSKYQFDKELIYFCNFGNFF